MSEKKPKNAQLSRAKKAKEDEFYTQRSDIEKELAHYKQYFKDKVVLCNCDDPFESEFFRYFAVKFNHLKLKNLLQQAMQIRQYNVHCLILTLNLARVIENHIKPSSQNYTTSQAMALKTC